ncbi:hypothetical protein CHARACLAT_017185 [Characodon lateralis]|uniref:Uncharacterized protein n=1 Tax=Characodon lateralis TaxID=208331 RepID=A0ABU7CP04_9TELE|nr:hypothetical protein [Characodon lateralis]
MLWNNILLQDPVTVHFLFLAEVRHLLLENAPITESVHVAMHSKNLAPEEKQARSITNLPPYLKGGTKLNARRECRGSSRQIKPLTHISRVVLKFSQRQNRLVDFIFR